MQQDFASREVVKACPPRLRVTSVVGTYLGAEVQVRYGTGSLKWQELMNGEATATLTGDDGERRFRVSLINI